MRPLPIWLPVTIGLAWTAAGAALFVKGLDRQDMFIGCLAVGIGGLFLELYRMRSVK